jgi:hypothetical protein
MHRSALVVVGLCVIGLGVAGCNAEPTPPDPETDAGRSDAGGPRDTGGGGGTDSPGPQSCEGTATPCDLLSGTACTSTDGCYASGDCTGFARSCSSFTSSGTCGGQLGCYWSSTTSSCAGSAWSCSTTSAEENCRSIMGCTWMDGCSGFSSCILQDTETACLAVMGCRWE